VVAAAAVAEVGEELEQLDEDHACKAQQRVIDDEVEDVVGGGEDARRRRPRVAALLPEEATQRQPSVLSEGARLTKTNVTGAEWITHLGRSNRVG